MTRNGRLPLGDPDTLRQLLVSRGAPAGAGDRELLRVARLPEHKLAVTLLSAWEATGRALTAQQRAELAENRHRIGRYAGTWRLISQAAPTAYLVKGQVIGACYPPGLLRAAGDLDVICPEPQLWAAARVLLEGDWELRAFTIFPGAAPFPGAALPGGEAAGWDLLIELAQPSDTGIEEPYAVELRTAEVATSLLTPAVRSAAGSSSPVAASVLALAAERWERPYRTRDVYDLAVLSGRLDPAGQARLRAGLAATGLWPQLRELSCCLHRSGLGQGVPLPDGRRQARRARAARLVRTARHLAHPVRALGYLSMITVDQDRGVLADRLAQLACQRIGTGRLLRLGLPLFGVPLPGAPVAVPPAAGPARAPEGSLSGALLAPSGLAPSGHNGARLVQRAGHLVALTPAGAFLMVAGSCPQTWLAEAAQGLRPADYIDMYSAGCGRGAHGRSGTSAG